MGVKIEERMGQSRPDPAKDIEKQIRDVAEKVFHVVPENP